MKLVICEDYEAMSKEAGALFLDRIRKKPDLRLGLATGSTPEGLYRVLVAAYQAGEMDFSRVVSYNLDEYLGIDRAHPQSYHYFMKGHLFSAVNIPLEQTHFPDEEEEPGAYDARIEADGGLDLQVLGIGQNGHIAFNEPAPALSVPTARVDLSESTIAANARFFDRPADVPRHAISMGMGTILKARELVILANGPAKREAVAKLLAGDQVTTQWPVTLCLLHPNCTLFVDQEAAGR